MMPNGALSNSNIVNVGAEGIRRLDINVGISYGSDVTKAKEILRDIISEYPLVMKDKGIDVIVKSLDESCVTLETRCWVSQDTYWDTRFIFLEKFKQEFDRYGEERITLQNICIVLPDLGCLPALHLEFLASTQKETSTEVASGSCSCQTGDNHILRLAECPQPLQARWCRHSPHGLRLCPYF